MPLTIEPGDVLTRTGLVGAYGFRFNILSAFINEPYNHSGLAVSAFGVHHVESNGYETVLISDFFKCSNAGGGAVIRFKGPFAQEIRAQAADVARKGRYPRFPGNPFSSSNNANTVNCNEFVYSLYQIAIRELLEKFSKTDPGKFATMAKTYSKSTLIQPTRIQVKTPGAISGRIARGAEIVGRTQASHPEVKIQFEGTLKCLVGYNWFCLQSEAVLDAYTPNSFLRSSFFTIVEKRGCTR